MEAKEIPASLQQIQPVKKSPRKVRDPREIHVGVGGISYAPHQDDESAESTAMAKKANTRMAQYSRLEAHLYEGPILSTGRQRGGDRDSFTANHISDRLASERAHVNPASMLGHEDPYPTHAATARPAYRMDKYSSNSVREIEEVPPAPPEPTPEVDEQCLRCKPIYDGAVVSLRSLVFKVACCSPDATLLREVRSR